MDPIDEILDEEVTAISEQDVIIPPNAVIDEEETGMVDKLAANAAKTLGLVDEETTANVKALKAAAVRNKMYAKAQAAQKIQGIIKVVIYIVVIVLILGTIYLAWTLITKGKSGVQKVLRTISGHKNGYA
jgi:hypothetical protein